MTGVAFTVLCVALAGALLAIATGWERAKPWRAAITVAGVCAAPALIGICLMAAGLERHFGEMRLTLESVTAEVGVRPLTIGGDPERDDLVVDGMPSGVASISLGRSRDAAPGLALNIPAADAGESSKEALVSLGRREGLRFPSAIRFKQGDAVCIDAPCDRDGAAWAILRGTRFLPARLKDGAVVAVPAAPKGMPMPQRLTLGFIPGLVSWTPRQAIHPLRDYFPHPAAPKNKLLTDCEVWACVGRGDARQTASSYLFQAGGPLGGEWSLVLADPGARAASPDDAGTLRPDPEVESPQRALGEGETVGLWEPRFREIDRKDSKSPRGWLLERRSMTATLREDGRARITFRSRPIQVVGKCDGAALIQPLSRLAGAGAPSDGAAAFTSLGGLLGAATTAALPHPPEAHCNTFLRYGFDVGNKQRQASYLLERFGLPWPMLWIALGWLVATLFCARQTWTADRTSWAILCVMQFLLALRWLIALAGAAADPVIDWRSALGDAGIAYVVMPAILIAWARSRRPLDRADAILAGFPLASLAAVWLWTGPPSGLSIAFCLLFLGVMTLRLILAEKARTRRKAARTESRWARAKAAIASRREAAAAALTSDRLGKLFVEDARAWLWLLLGVTAVRLLLGVIGVKERFTLPGTVLGVSVIYTPFLIFGFASLMKARIDAKPSKRPGLALWFGVLLLWATVITPKLVNDVGYAITLAPIAGLAAWWSLKRRDAEPLSGGRLLWAAPAIAAALCLLGLILAPAAERLIRPEARDTAILAQVAEQRAKSRNTDPDQEALAILAERTASDDNMLRIFLIAAPDWLASSGTTQAETLRVWSNHLSAYTSTLWGRGYLHEADLTELRPVQMSDNVAAVHIMSPFGRLGAAALILLLVALPLACGQIGGSPQRGSRQQIIGHLALWILAGAAIYMILANLQLTLFTGRNLYLLAPLSGSDQLEGGMLLYLAYWALKERRSHGR
jgi:hypothetical protein